jgi:hypothetical protein
MIRLFVITHNTKDYGNLFVVRENRDGNPSLKPALICETLEAARDFIFRKHPKFVRLAPWKGDDPVIVESYGSRSDIELLASIQAVLKAR